MCPKHPSQIQQHLRCSILFMMKFSCIMLDPENQYWAQWREITHSYDFANLKSCGAPDAWLVKDWSIFLCARIKSIANFELWKSIIHIFRSFSHLQLYFILKNVNKHVLTKLQNKTKIKHITKNLHWKENWTIIQKNHFVVQIGTLWHTDFELLLEYCMAKLLFFLLTWESIRSGQVQFSFSHNITNLSFHSMHCDRNITRIQGKALYIH